MIILQCIDLLLAALGRAFSQTWSLFYYASSVYLFILKSSVFAKFLEGWSAINWEASKGTVGGVQMLCWLWQECSRVWCDLVVSELLSVSCWFALACFCTAQQNHPGKGVCTPFLLHQLEKLENAASIGCDCVQNVRFSLLAVQFPQKDCPMGVPFSSYLMWQLHFLHYFL